jgi:energy-coupling factor transporter ATP-binding protein EcfA2
MLGKSLLNADELFDPATLWRLLPSALPGRILRYLGEGSTRGFVEVLVQVRYPNGAPMTEVYCKELDGLARGEFVLFGLTPASDWERQKPRPPDAKSQPDLMEAKAIRRASETDIHEAIRQFDAIRNSRLADELQSKIRSVDAVIVDRIARIEKDAQEQAARQKKAEAERLEKLEKDEKSHLAALEKAERERLQKLDIIEATQKALLDGRERKLADKETRLDLRESAVQIEVDRLVGEKVGGRLVEISEREAETARREQDVEKSETWLKSREVQLEGERKQFAEAKARFRDEGGERFLAVLATLDDQSEQSYEPLADSWPPSPDLVDRLAKGIAEHRYKATPALISQFLLSTCVAAFSGQFVVLTGPTGVGKTSLVSVMAAALDASAGTVPVRPAWLDPTDLLGFYNPHRNRFQPTPFMDKLLAARRCADANRLYLLCLDEMNLSRVENYAADFLSLLEKTHSGEAGARLNLYALELEQQLRREANRLRQQTGTATSDAAVEFAALQRHLDQYPAQMEIPGNLVLYGTINLDETTHTLSPKFLDRSLVVQITHPALAEHLPEIAEQNAIRTIWGLTVTEIQQMFAKDFSPTASAKRAQQPAKGSTEIWQDVVGWQQQYPEPLGIRLGYRFPQVFRLYMRCAGWLGITSEQAVNAFFHAKLLPWISFHREEKAPGQRNTTKLAVLQRWAKDAKVTQYSAENGLPAVLERLANRETTVIQYLE